MRRVVHGVRSDRARGGACSFRDYVERGDEGVSHVSPLPSLDIVEEVGGKTGENSLVGHVYSAGEDQVPERRRVC